MIGLIACGSKKRNTPCQAKDLYISSLFVATRRYVEKRTLRWAILSAKHGVLLPEQLVQPYNVRLGSLPARSKKVWAERTREQLLSLFPGETFLVLAGQDYFQAVEGLPYARPIPEGFRIGQQIAWLKQNT